MIPEQQDMPAHVREHLANKMIGQEISGFRIKEKLGAGNTAITYGVEDPDGFPWALKLVTAESYGERAPSREVARFAGVRDERFLVFPKEIGEWELKLENEAFDFIWFKSRRVGGQTLKDYVDSGVPFNARTEVEKCIEHLTVAFEELARIGFAHGDAHGGNVMREVVGKDSALPEVKYVVIDFSESHRVQDTQGGLQKDMECFGQHLQAFADAISRRQPLSRDDERVLSAIQHIPGLLRGVTADSIGIRKPSDVLDRFRENLIAAEESPRKLRTPFDALSAEDIKNDALLIDLCFTKSWWAAELEKPGNVLLVGPRGCGKTMLFRRLRLKTKILAGKTDEVTDDDFVGFYLPCESLFFNRISDLTDSLVEKNKNALILFFNMAVTLEVASTLAYLPDSFGRVSAHAIEPLRKLLREEAGPLWDELKLPGAGVSLLELAECAERVMRQIRGSIAVGQEVHAVGSTEFVTRLVTLIKQKIPRLSARLFIFFLDDYTEERVPLTLQKMLHPVVCQRSSELCFKISAHMFGSIYSFPQPLALDEGRNITIINLGSEYLNPKKKKAEKKALVQIVNKRFEECDGYRGTIEEWLGNTSYPNKKSLNRALHDKDTRLQTKYHGIKCLVDLCTGDISEMIRMVGEIFRRAGVSDGTQVRAIEPGIQDRAIRNVSRDFLSRIRNIRPDGQDLFDVVDSFGILSQQVLYERPLVGQGQDSSGQARQDPYDLLTIYVDDLTKALPFARRVWERLQRASIFVDIRLAPSQRTVIADRVTLRRIYCPAFATTLTSSEHLQLSKDQFERFMDEPANFCKEYFRRNVKEVQGTTLWDLEEKKEPEVDESEPQPSALTLPEDSDQLDFRQYAPQEYKATITRLPAPQRVKRVVKPNSSYDIFIGALGFEERTTKAIQALVEKGVRVKRALLLEFDLFQQETEKRRDKYEQLISKLTGGGVYRPVNAPVAGPDPNLPERLTDALTAASKGGYVRVLFDCTSCPSRILSKCLRVLLDYPCDLTILYSEADKYYPTKEQWESGIVKPGVTRIEGPFSGVRFVEKPPTLQADDIGESPVLLVLFHTFNTERTSGVLAEIGPAKRIWIIGEPHDLDANRYRIDMAKAFAAPAMYQGDEWTLVTTFDYRASLETLAGIYRKKRADYRIAIMPHGSKMQTLAVNLFAVAHEVSMVFAMPKDYNPKQYSEGCRQTWALPFGDTNVLKELLRTDRVLGGSGT